MASEQWLHENRTRPDIAQSGDVPSQGEAISARRSLSDSYRDSDDEFFGVPSEGGPAVDEPEVEPGQADLFSRTLDRTNQEMLDDESGISRTLETVRRYAERAGIDLSGVAVEVIEDPETIRYLDYAGAIARTDAQGVQLGPAAFINEETLVRTLAHERIHVTQYREDRVDSDTQRLEDEAYAAEDIYVARWRGSAS